MTQLRKPFLYTLAWLGLMLPLLVTAAPTSVEGAINMAGKQRMLSQRMVVNYCMVGLGILPESSRQTMNEDARLFEEQLTELKGFSDDEVYLESLEWVTIAWDRFRPLLLEGEPERDRVRRLNHLSEDLLYTSNKVALLLQEMGNRPVDRLVNVAGRQRMLSQRVAKFYLMRSWGVSGMGVTDELNKAAAEFERAMEVLRTAPEATGAIRVNIDKALVQWGWLKGVINRPGADPTYRLLVADAGHALYRMMDQITAQFEAVAGS